MSERLERLIRAMSERDFYPHGPDSVEVIQTHISVVFIAGDLVYKIKKPVNFGFLDFTTPEKRKHFCNQEVVLNSRFSKGIYLDVVPVFETRDGPSLHGEGDAIDYAVLMRRIPENRLMINMLDRDEITPEILDRVADRLAYFHSLASNKPPIAGFGSKEVIRQNLTENFTQTLPYVGRTIEPATHEAIRTRSFEFLHRRHRLIEERMKSGFIRDCHGDLHVDHVVILDGIMLCDCIEFNDRFRYGDTASDLSFLLMDLDYRGFPAFSKRIARRYAESSGDSRVLELVDFYKSYRAFVRGKVISFTLDEQEISASEKEAARTTARDYFRMSLASLLPPAPPTLIITCGLTGTGKSFLGARLGKRLGIEPLRSDVIRKELFGVPKGEHRLDKYGEGIYTANATETTYRALLEKARTCLERGESVILDASFVKYDDRAQARLTAIRSKARFRLIECVSPSEEAIRSRLDERLSSRPDPSDGRWEIFRQQKAGFEWIREDERTDHRLWDSTTDINSFLASFVRELASS